jgi:hypothetical protein
MTTPTQRVSPAQLRADLERLYHSVCKGWSALGQATPTDIFPQVKRRYGVAATNTLLHNYDHGCAWQQMDALVKADLKISRNHLASLLDPKFEELSDRRDAMVAALGFPTAEKMFKWNDAATWDEVKEHIKDAIGKL